MIPFINISLGSGRATPLLDKITSFFDSGDLIIGVFLDLKNI